MANISGVKILKNATGKATHITLSISKWGHLVEDLLDSLAIEKNKNEPRIPWEAVKKRLDAKHGIKPKRKAK